MTTPAKKPKPKAAKKQTHPWRLRGGRSPDYRDHPALPDMRSRVLAR
jgi:hypothetical protein